MKCSVPLIARLWTGTTLEGGTDLGVFIGGWCVSLTGQRCDICEFSGFGFDYIFSFVERVLYLIPVLWYYARERGFVFDSCNIVYCS